MKIMETCGGLLGDAEFMTFYEKDALLFEDQTVFGAIRVFATVEAILEEWEEIQDRFIDRWSRQIRTASSKRWNAYLCLLSSAPASETQRSNLLRIEEDLRSMRKIASASVTTKGDVKRALYPLLAIQSLASMKEEERLAERLERRTSLDTALIGAFEEERSPRWIAELLLEEDVS